MITMMLMSILNTHTKDEEGIRHAIALDDENMVLSNIKKNLKHSHKFVYVMNDPMDYEENDARFEVMSKSFEMSNLNFDEKYMLDGRNMSSAKNILEDADLIVLAGGRIICELEFFAKINLAKILSKSDALVIGISAGTMNLCQDVFNFPEWQVDVERAEERWLKGLGFYDKIMIPHFDGVSKTYQNPYTDINVAKDYILPGSMGREFIAISNESYLIVKNNKTQIFGEAYLIKNGEVSKLDKI